MPAQNTRARVEISDAERSIIDDILDFLLAGQDSSDESTACRESSFDQASWRSSFDESFDESYFTNSFGKYQPTCRNENNQYDNDNERHEKYQIFLEENRRRNELAAAGSNNTRYCWPKTVYVPVERLNCASHTSNKQDGDGDEEREHGTFTRGIMNNKSSSSKLPDADEWEWDMNRKKYISRLRSLKNKSKKINNQQQQSTGTSVNEAEKSRRCFGKTKNRCVDDDNERPRSLLDRLTCKPVREKDNEQHANDIDLLFLDEYLIEKGYKATKRKPWKKLICQSSQSDFELLIDHAYKSLKPIKKTIKDTHKSIRKEFFNTY